jgi:Kef-type K+ transport system membrane component KefB/Trk K+ transport system NAD-binding subunit
MEIFVEISLLLFIATISALLMRFLKQPLVVGYILAGIAVGPYFLNILHSKDHIELFSKIGITILLFIVGLSLSPAVIKEVGRVSIVTGVGQVVFTSLVGFILALLLGIERIAALYIAIALTFSSTIIVLKLLSDRGDLDKLYGKIAIGFLLVQDIIATVILLFVSSFAQTQNADVASILWWFFIKSITLLSGLYLFTSFVVPRLVKYVASSQEILFLFSMTWGLGMATLFYVLGFSIEIGALIAGVILSLTPFAYEIGARLKPLRDFFIVLFFILLGSQMVLTNIGQILVPAILLSIFVLFGNPVIVVILMSILGHKRRTGFMAGLTVAQISEFSLILAALGYSVGHLSAEMLSLVTLVGLITIAGSTYFILYADHIYPRVEKLLKFLEFKKSKGESESRAENIKFILFGYYRVGADFVNLFKRLDKPYLVVDFNPDSIKKLDDEGIPHRFGDAEDIEFLDELSFDKLELCVSTIAEFRTNMILTQKIREVNKKVIIIVLSNYLKEAEELYNAGASYVMMPHYLGARHTANMILRLEGDRKDFEEEKQKHIAYIEKRKSLI